MRGIFIFPEDLEVLQFEISKLSIIIVCAAKMRDKPSQLV